MIGQIPNPYKMKTCSKLIIIHSLLCFCMTNLSNADSCNRISCPSRTELFSSDVSIKYPFRVNNVQPKSCGKPGFDVYCDNILGTLIQLPNNAVLEVDSIDYYSERMSLSDPDDKCLPKKLLSLNLTGSPFGPADYTNKFWLYNCSGDHLFGYDRIDCLSGSDYTVISSASDIINVVSSSCTFVKTLIAPAYRYRSFLSTISSINLVWTGTVDPGNRSYGNTPAVVGLVLGLVGTVASVIFALYCGCRNLRNQQSSSTITNTNETTTSTSNVVGGLDRVTIDSYPVVVVGESGRLIKPDDNTCAICLSEYHPHETLKILPECLHRFHSGCIDQWLLSKGDCPICRTSPLRPS